MNKKSFKERYGEAKIFADRAVEKHLHNIKPDTPERLFKAMKYSLMTGGKRVRPVLLKWAASAGNPDPGVLWRAMAAIEYVHTYSLIHDDLPAMDDDDFRRGKKSLHRKFDQATAILAGDALLTEAFFLLGQTGISRLSIILAEYSGARGMVAGQVSDIERKGSREHINELKTARLFLAAAEMGAVAGGLAEKDVDKLCSYGINVGKAFQLRDDLLDREASHIDELNKKAAGLTGKAKDIIKDTGAPPELLELADFIIKRKK